MLKQRVITASILIPLVVLAVLNSSTATMTWLVSGLVLLAAWEWFEVIGLKSLVEKLLAFSALILSSILVGEFINDSTIVYSAAIVWGLFSLFVVAFASRAIPPSIAYLFKQRFSATFMAIATLVLFFHTSLLLHQIPEIGPRLMLFVMITVWLADTGGYFAGKRWGKHKLASMISPNKTWQGVAGAIVLVVVGALCAFPALSNGPISLIEWVSLIVITALFSIIGDLIESVFKRTHNVKDSGNLLPGHGGVLDRIDSLLAAIPVFIIGLHLMGVI
jgi:phosphatidate cytidylyltransferase